MSCIRVQGIIAGLVLSVGSLYTPSIGVAQSDTVSGQPVRGAVLVELFTSEGCSSCPPADDLLRQINGRISHQGQLVIGLSEHVSYWDSLGWKDTYSSDIYTGRQDDYSARFGLSGVYTPQMVVNGREQFVGGDRRALEAALASEAKRKQIDLHIVSAQVDPSRIVFTYSATNLPAKISLQLVAALVDDMERTNVRRGENSGRELIHASVVRALAPLGPLHETEQRSVSLPLPPSLTVSSGTGHHIVLFAQQDRAGAVMGIDTKPI